MPRRNYLKVKVYKPRPNNEIKRIMKNLRTAENLTIITQSQKISSKEELDMKKKNSE